VRKWRVKKRGVAREERREKREERREKRSVQTIGMTSGLRMRGANREPQAEACTTVRTARR